MGEEKVSSADEKENLGKVILEIGGLMAAAFMLCAYGLGGMLQGSILGALSLTLGIVFVGLSCMATLKGGMWKNLKKYINGEYEEKKQDSGKKIGEEKVIFGKEYFWKILLKACALTTIASVFFACGVNSILQSNLSEALSSSFVILCIFLWGFACFVIIKKSYVEVKKI
jgi:hypothetical protein